MVVAIVSNFIDTISYFGSILGVARRNGPALFASWRGNEKNGGEGRKDKPRQSLDSAFRSSRFFFFFARLARFFSRFASFCFRASSRLCASRRSLLGT